MPSGLTASLAGHVPTGTLATAALVVILNAGTILLY
jgi:hypothetical protein